jgi:fructokinase
MSSEMPKVLCIGEILYDRLADQAGVDLDQVQSWTAHAGGAPANVATALEKLGTHSGLISAVGQDTDGIALTQLVAAVGVDISGIQIIADAPTRSVLVLRNADGDRHFAGFADQIPTTEFADTKLAGHFPPRLFQAVEILVTGSLGLTYSDSRASILQAIALTKQRSGKVLLDVNWRPVFWVAPQVAPGMIRDLIQQVDFLKLSIEESEWLFHHDNVLQITEQFPHLLGIIITAGEVGCKYWLMGNRGELPAFDIPVVDTTGAGDSFVAGFIHQLCTYGIDACRSATMAHEIMRYASATGALTTMQAGAIAAQPTNHDVTAFLLHQSQI